MRGEAAINGAMAARILREFGRLSTQPVSHPNQDVPDLTFREREVLESMAQGAMNKEIADQLTISLSTVKTHVSNILAKLHATSRRQAVIYAVQEGLIRPPRTGDAVQES